MKTYWHGKECPARRVLVRALDTDGTPMRAVEVITPGGRTVYLDDRDGSAWQVLTVGLGAAGVFRLTEILIVEVIDEPPNGICPAQSCRAAACGSCASA